MSARFNPIVDGWSFENFDGIAATWDLYRDTYLGINPSHNCVEAPFDCLFYENAFKDLGKNGHCAGISLLGLAIFKYGGYMGFCSPASLYNGDENGPTRLDLRRALDILQARNFSLGAIENFLDVVDAGNLNNAIAAYDRIEEGLASGDYATLSLANGPYPDGIEDSGHVLIPFDCYKIGSTKYIKLWDPNFPADQFPGHYEFDHLGTGHDEMVIHSPTDWEYHGNPGVSPDSSYPYLGSSGGWCFAIPMSRVLSKDRQPASPDLLIEGIISVFISGLGASISQISDEQGHTLYTTKATRKEFETDPDKRLKGVMLWPALGRAKGAAEPGELYVIRGRTGRAPLTFTVSGTEYKFSHLQGRSMTVVEGNAAKRTKDVIRISPAPYDLRRTVEVRSGGQRELNLQTLRMDDERGAWKSVELKNVKLANSALRMHVIGALDDVQVNGIRKKVEFNLRVQERKRNKLSSKQYKNVTADAKEPFRLARKRRKK